MPTSDYLAIPDVLRVVIGSRAESVLDIGVGFGKWGPLCREYIEVSRGRMPGEWRSTIHGIEIFETYRNRNWAAYDEVFIGDVLTILPTLARYDAILCCDVIEHFEKAEGQRLLREMLAHAKIVVITSPRGESPQGPEYGNAHEEHKSVWSEADFEAHPHRFADISDTFIAVVANDEEALRGVEVREPLEWLGVKNVSKTLLRMIAKRVTGRR